MSTEAAHRVEGIVSIFGLESAEVAFAQRCFEEASLRDHYQDLEDATRLYLKADSLLGGQEQYRGLENTDLAATVCRRLASIMVRQHRHEEATLYYGKALSLDPENRSLAEELGHHILRHGTAGEIEAFFSEKAACWPDWGMAAFALAGQRDFLRFVDMAKTAMDETLRHRGTSRPAVVTMPLWGENHTSLFLDHVLPALLAPGNIPALAGRYDLSFLLFTTEDTFDRLEGDPKFGRLREFVPVQPIFFTPSLMAFSDQRVAQFQLLSISHYATLEAARRAAVMVFFAFPDNIVNDQFYSLAADHMSRGAAAVTCAGFRLHMDAVLPDIGGRYRRDDGVLSLPSAAIVDLVTRNLDDQWFADSENFAASPFFICWRVGNDGILVRAHHQPYAIDSGALAGEVTLRVDPLDGQFMARHVRDIDGIVCIENAEMCCFDVGTEPSLDPEGSLPRRRFDEKAFARFLHTYDTPLHRKYLATPLRLESGPPTGDWLEIIGQSGRMLERVFAMMDAFDAAGPRHLDWAGERAGADVAPVRQARAQR